MKKINVYTVIIGCLFLFSMFSCDQENIGVEYDLNNSGISFSQTTALTGLPDATSIDYNIMRGNVEGNLELSITATYDTEIFTLPSSVVFENGSGMATLTIPLDKTVLGTVYQIELAIDSAVISPSGIAKTTLNVMRDYNWVDAGTANWTDGIVSTPFAYGNPLTYEVQVQQAEGTEGMYRMVNPYGAGVFEHTFPEEMVRETTYIVIDARDPEKVIIDETGIGIDWGYGEIYFVTYSAEGGKRVGTTITFPAETFGIGMRAYQTGGLYWLNSSPCVLELDPKPVFDYSAAIEFTGRYTDPAGNDFCNGSITSLGKDVNYAKVALIAGQWDEAFIDGIVDGTIESVEIKETGPISVPCAEQGIHTFVVLTFDAENNAKEAAYVTFVFPPISVNVEDFYGNYIFTGPSQFQGGQPANMTVTIEGREEQNTLLIKGIDIVDSLTATFDPVTGYMLIAPQQVADFIDEDGMIGDPGIAYPMELLTTTSTGEIGTEFIIALTRNVDGSLGLASSSESDGYVLKLSEIEDGYIDGYYNPVFTPSGIEKAVAAAKPAATLKTAPLSPHSSVAPGIENKKAEILKTGSFTIGKKTVLKQIAFEGNQLFR